MSSVQQMLALAVRHHQAGQLGEAERLYRQILQVDSRHGDALHFLGVIAHQRGNNDAALELIGQAIEVNGRMPAFHNNHGNVCKALGRLEEAAASYKRALTYKPDHVEAHYNLGIVLQSQDKLEEAAASYGRALSYKPAHAQAHNNLGNVLQAQGNLEAAAAAYGRALALNPGFVEAHSNLGNVFKAQGRLTDAIASYRRALALKPDCVVHNNLGLALLDQGNVGEAVASFEQALVQEPNYTEAHYNLGNALKEQGRLDEAVASYGRALTLEPDYPEAQLGLAIAAIPIFADSSADSLEATGKFARSLDDLTAWSAAHPGQLGKAAGMDQPFYLAYRPSDVTGLLTRYGDLVGAAAAGHWRPEVGDGPPARIARSRIRVVIVSGQVRQHPVWDVILRGIIAHVDRTRFEIFVYHTRAMTDEKTTWARANVDRFVQGPRSVKSWLGEVVRDQPDVLFYPEVGMDPATCALASLRLAPLQVASWGHPVTTGLPTIDMYLSAALLEGPDGDQHYREKLVRLPGTGVCTDWAATVQTAPWDGPARQAGVVRFALCQQPIKFDPADDALWVRIAKAAGPCELWLASPNKLDWTAARLRARLSAVFGAEGLDPDLYLRVMPWLTRAQFSGFLEAMDVYLDCPAFSGYTTALQAIHCGVPIVTLEGEFLRQRLAAGLLRHIGLTEGIASDREQYEEIAVRWAQECREPGLRAARREAMYGAAPKSDGNRSAIEAFEQALLRATGSSAPTHLPASSS